MSSQTSLVAKQCHKIFDKEDRDIVRKQSEWMAKYYGYHLLREQYLRNGELQRLLRKNETPEDIRKKIMEDSLGFNDSQILVAFAYNTPNNTLPIIWMETDTWSPLFKRYDKVYTAQMVGGIINDNVYV